MNLKKKITRKTFFKWATVALLLPFYKVWQSSVNRSQAFVRQSHTLQVEANLPNGIYIHDRVILVKENGEVRLLSSKCTHLGCKINKTENGEMVCPCHGSRYNLRGDPVKGPAVESLPEISFDTITENGNVILEFRL